ncbi:transmembrane protein 14C [Schistocerca piceifrons]|uniref:transmembrane protein 14C n=1 Tax=Schistocerca piceifrons TaxID=274613 RepID=UPI001F5FA6DD|nr:transmembrane protein 14C [Schistocerca piceifrons]XP_049790461.1 transmembrane protein 14C [Schistocerca nitens]
MGADLLGFAYAATVAAGGILGYVKAGSVPSLGAGLLFGGILGYGAYQISQDPNDYHILLGTSTALGGLMGYRFYNSGKFMPAGLVAALSVAMVLRIGAQRVGLVGIKK